MGGGEGNVGNGWQGRPRRRTHLLDVGLIAPVERLHGRRNTGEPLRSDWREGMERNMSSRLNLSQNCLNLNYTCANIRTH